MYDKTHYNKIKNLKKNHNVTLDERHVYGTLSEWDTEYVDTCASNECSLMFNGGVVNFSTKIEKKVNYVAFY